MRSYLLTIAIAMALVLVSASIAIAEPTGSTGSSGDTGYTGPTEAPTPEPPPEPTGNTGATGGTGSTGAVYPPIADHPLYFFSPTEAASYTSSAVPLLYVIYDQWGYTDGVYKYPFCRLDGAAWANCPPIAEGLHDGQHTLDAVLRTSWSISSGSVIAGSEQSISFTTADSTASTISLTPPAGSTLTDSSTLIQVQTEIDTTNVSVSSGDGMSAPCSLYQMNTYYLYPPGMYVPTDKIFRCLPPGITNGSNDLTFIASDGAGNQTTALGTYSYDDLAPPVIEIDTPLDGSVRETRTFTGHYSVTGATSSSIRCVVDSQPSQGCYSGTNNNFYFNQLTYGTHSFTISAQDGVGNAATNTSHFTISDTTPPLLAITSPQDGGTFTDGPPLVTFTQSDSSGETVTTHCRLDNETWELCYGSSFYIDRTTNGVHTAYVRATDVAGNSTTQSISFTLDDPLAPVISILSPAPNAVFDTSPIDEPTYSVDDNEATVTCLIDGVQNGCEADYGWVYLGELGNGLHELTVVATDRAGNVGTAAVSFTLADIVAPDLTITSPAPSASLADADDVLVEFTVAYEPGLSLKCSLDGAAFTDYDVDYRTCYYSGLSNGEHTVGVRAADSAGNLIDRYVTFIVADTTGPVITITAPAGGDGTLFNDLPTFQFNVGGAQGYARCSVDLGYVSNCWSSYTPSDLLLGSHVLTITATDSVGNATVKTLSFEYQDTTPPTVSIISPANGSVVTSAPLQSPNISYNYNDVWRLRCVVDGLPMGWSTGGCYGGSAWSLVGNGPHRLTAYASDRFGNTTIVSSDFTVNDTSAGAVTITSPLPGATVTDSAASITFSPADWNEWGGWTCRIDQRPWQYCDTYSGFKPVKMSNGPHTAQVRRVDNEGRVSQASVAFTVADYSPPSIQITAPANGVTDDDGRVALQYAQSGTNSSVKCFIDGVSSSYCWSGMSIQLAGSGSHTLTVVINDPAGNVATDSVQVTVPGVGPGDAMNPVITSPTEGQIMRSSFVVRYSTNRAAVNRLRGWVDDEYPRRLKINSTGWYPGPLLNGSHEINLEATDDRGNVERASRAVVVNDTIPPTVEITSPADGAVVTASPPRIRFATDSDVAQTECKTDDGPFASCNSFFTYRPRPLTNGSHTVTVRATDYSGMQGTDSLTFDLQDVTPPQFSILAPVEGSTIDGPIKLKLDIPTADNQSSIRCTLNGSVVPADPQQSCSRTQLLDRMQPGANTLTVELTDGVGNSAVRTVRFTANVTSTPLVRILRPINGAVFNDSSQVYAVWFTRGYDALGYPSVTLTPECQVDGGNWSRVCMFALGNGHHTLAIRATDFVGNSASAETQYDVQDGVAPVVTIDSPASGAVTPDGAVSLEFVSDGAAEFECAIDSTTSYFPCYSGFKLGESRMGYGENDPVSARLEPGDHVLRVRATDPAGNSSTAISDFAVDAQITDTEITAGPSGPMNDNTPTFTITTIPPDASIECRIDNASWLAVTSPFTAPAQVDGAHTIECRGINGNGNGDQTPAYRSFVVDTVAPNTAVVSGPSSMTKDPTPAFLLSATESQATFECKVDDGLWAGSPIGFTTAALPDGSHTVECRATDAAGNTDASPASRVFVVDTQPPETTFSSGPTLTNDTTPLYALDSDEANSAFVCRVDGGAWLPTSAATFTSTELQDGDHTIECEAIDLAGNVDQSPASRAVKIDTVPPETSIPSPPPALSKNLTVGFDIAANEEGSTIQCSLGTPLQSAGLWHLELTGLPDGSYTVQCAATDPAGNHDPSPAVVTFDLDRTAPNITPTHPFNGEFIPTSSPHFTFTVSDAHAWTATCSVDDADPAACTTQFDPVGVAPGVHVFRVRAEDLLGNFATADIQFAVDTVAPDTFVLGGPPLLNNYDFASIDLASDEYVERFNCRKNLEPWHVIHDTTFEVYGLTSGSYTLECAAIDRAGNVDPTPVTYSFTVDKDPPALEITHPSPGEVLDASDVGIEFTSDGGGLAGPGCRVDGNAFAACSSPFSAQGLSDGPHTAQVKLSDAAGNTTTRSVAFVVDTLPPDTSFTSVPQALSEDTTPSVTMQSNENGAVFECRVDAGVWTAATNALFAAPTLENGEHSIDCRAKDLAGNYDETPVSVTFTIDASPPEISFDEGVQGATFADATPSLGFEVHDAQSVIVKCSVDSAPLATCSSPFTSALLADGDHSFTVQADDAAGNRATKSAQFTVAAPPVVAQAGDDLVVERGATVAFDGAASTPHEFVDGWEWTFSDGGTATGEHVTHAFNTAGNFEVTLAASGNGRSGQDTAQVQVIDPPAGSGARVTVRGDGALLPGADILVVLGNGRRISAVSGNDGVGYLRGLPDGTVSVYAYKKGFKPQAVPLNVLAGGGEVEVTLERGELGAADMTQRRLTLDEIVGLGIDPSDPANQNIEEFTINLKLDGFTYPIRGYYGGLYGGGGGGGGGSAWGLSGGGCVSRGTYLTCGDKTVTPCRGQAGGCFLIMSGKARFLKEFFEVSMVVANQTDSGFSFAPGAAQLELPTGLSLAPTGTPQAASVSVSIIPGGGSATATWIVRGDKEGEYDLSASYRSTLEPFGTPVQLDARTGKPLKVWGGSAVKMIVDADNLALRHEPFHVKIGLQNVSDATVYNPGVAMTQQPDAGFIYQPREQLDKSTDSIPPGTTWWTDDYILAPRSGGNLNVAQSFVRKIGGNVQLDSTIQSHERAATRAMRVYRLEDKVVLDWAPIPGASDYKVFSTDDDGTPFPVDAMQMRTAAADGSQLSADGTKAIVDGVHPPTRLFAVSGMVNGKPRMEHSLMSSEQAAGPSAEVSGSCSRRGALTQIKVSFNDDIIDLDSYSSLSINGEQLSAGDLSGSDAVRTFTVRSKGFGGNDVSMRTNNVDGDHADTTEHGVGRCRQVSLGDSYSSGEGFGLYTNNTGSENGGNKCHRAVDAYPYKLEEALGEANAPEFNAAEDFLACSGDVAFDLTGDPGLGFEPATNKEPPQIPRVSRPEAVDLVTLTIGGNDMGFGPVITKCLVPDQLLPVHFCDEARTEVQIRMAAMSVQLPRIYAMMQDRFPNADIMVLGYPQFLPLVDLSNVPLLCYSLTPGRVMWIHNEIDRFNGVIESSVNHAATSNNLGRKGAVHFVGMNGFGGHDACQNSSDRWFTGIVTSDTQESFHPNELGHLRMAQLLANKVNDIADSESSQVIQQGQTLSRLVNVVSGLASATFRMAWPGSDVELELESPSGQIYSGQGTSDGENHAEGPTYEKFVVDDPEAGEWKVRMTGVDVDPGGEPVSFTFNPIEKVNLPPRAVPAMSPNVTAVTTTDNLQFDGTGSEDLDGSIASFEWNFGDGAAATGAAATHTYSTPGTYTPELTVTDDKGSSQSMALPAITVTAELIDLPTGGTTGGASQSPAGTPGGPAPNLLFSGARTASSVKAKRLRKSGLKVNIASAEEGSRISIRLLTTGKKKLLLGTGAVATKKTGAAVIQVRLNKAGLRFIAKLKSKQKAIVELTGTRSGNLPQIIALNIVIRR